MTLEPIYEVDQLPPHYDFRAGRWWICAPDHHCDGTHHYYVTSGTPA